MAFRARQLFQESGLGCAPGGYALYHTSEPGGSQRCFSLWSAPVDPALSEGLPRLNALANPHLPRLLELAEVEEGLVVEWEWIKGPTLAQYLGWWIREHRTAIPLPQLLHFMADAADGVDALHGSGLWHGAVCLEKMRLRRGHLVLIEPASIPGKTNSTSDEGEAGPLPQGSTLGNQVVDTDQLRRADLRGLVEVYLQLRTGQRVEIHNQGGLHWKNSNPEGRPLPLSSKEVEILQAAWTSESPDCGFSTALEWVKALAHCLGFLQRTTKRIARRSRRNEIYVDPQNGDVKTLEEAAKLVAPGGTIRLAEGCHWVDRPLTFHTSVHIVGEGSERTVVLSDSPGFILAFVAGKEYRVSGVAIEHLGLKPGHVLAFVGSKVTVEHVACHGAVHDPRANAGGVGLVARLCRNVAIKNCEASHNQWAGVCIELRGRIAIENLICEANGHFGLACIGKVLGTVTRTLLRHNRAGLVLAGRARLLATRNRCPENSEYGILFTESAKGVAKENWANANIVGISVEDRAAPVLERNWLENNSVSGIIVGGQARAVLKENRCTDNRDGVLVGGCAYARLEGNRCLNNELCGIGFWGRSGGVVRSNFCQQNLVGILVCDAAWPWVGKNRYSANFLDLRGTPRHMAWIARAVLSVIFHLLARIRNNLGSAIVFAAMVASGLGSVLTVTDGLLGLTMGVAMGLLTGFPVGFLAGYAEALDMSPGIVVALVFLLVGPIAFAITSVVQESWSPAGPILITATCVLITVGITLVARSLAQRLVTYLGRTF